MLHRCRREEQIADRGPRGSLWVEQCGDIRLQGGEERRYGAQFGGGLKRRESSWVGRRSDAGLGGGESGAVEADFVAADGRDAVEPDFVAADRRSTVVPDWAAA